MEIFEHIYSMVVWNWNKVTASYDPNRFVKLILPAVLGHILGPGTFVFHTHFQ